MRKIVALAVASMAATGALTAAVAAPAAAGATCYWQKSTDPSRAVLNCQGHTYYASVRMTWSCGSGSRVQTQAWAVGPGRGAWILACPSGRTIQRSFTVLS